MHTRPIATTPLIGPPRHCRWLGRSTGPGWPVRAATAALLLYPAFAGATDAAAATESVNALLSRDLIGAQGKEVLMITVTYLPGGASMPHRHDAQVFVYVLEGELTMQVRGAKAQTLGPGQTFYEGPGDVHEVSANASSTKPAKILVFMVKDKGKPASRPVTGKEAP
jgi:quercetin dioxygenase-like cupin family protein